MKPEIFVKRTVVKFLRREKSSSRLYLCTLIGRTEKTDHFVVENTDHIVLLLPLRNCTYAFVLISSLFHYLNLTIKCVRPSELMVLLENVTKWCVVLRALFQRLVCEIE